MQGCHRAQLQGLLYTSRSTGAPGGWHQGLDSHHNGLAARRTSGLVPTLGTPRPPAAVAAD